MSKEPTNNTDDDDFNVTYNLYKMNLLTLAKPVTVHSFIRVCAGQCVKWTSRTDDCIKTHTDTTGVDSTYVVITVRCHMECSTSGEPFFISTKHKIEEDAEVMSEEEFHKVYTVPATGCTTDSTTMCMTKDTYVKRMREFALYTPGIIMIPKPKLEPIPCMCHSQCTYKLPIVDTDDGNFEGWKSAFLM